VNQETIMHSATTEYHLLFFLTITDQTNHKPGRGSLAGLMPYGNANNVVLDMASEVLPIVKHTPVIAGICASDPFREMPQFLKQIKDLGFAGIQNFPTVGLIDGQFRQNLEETGMGFECEVEAVRLAREMGMLTTPYAVSTAVRVSIANDLILLVQCGGSQSNDRSRRGCPNPA